MNKVALFGGLGSFSQLVGGGAQEVSLELPAPRIAAWVFVRSIENALWAITTGMGDYRWDVACAQEAVRSFHLL